jgi:amino acid transporter
MGLNTVFGLVLCLCLAELAVMWPDRHGGVPSYAQESFTPLLGKRRAHWLGGFAGWSYWLGWFPVAPMRLMSSRELFRSLTPWSEPMSPRSTYLP